MKFGVLRQIFFPFEMKSFVVFSGDSIPAYFILFMWVVFAVSMFFFVRTIVNLKKDCKLKIEGAVEFPKSLSNLWKLYQMTFFDFEGHRKTKHSAEEFLGYSMLVSENMSRRTWGMMPGMFVGVGVLGTFVGLTYGIGGFNTQDTAAIQDSISQLLSGMNTAFCTSIWGMLLSIIFSYTEKRCFRSLKKDINILVGLLNSKYLISPTDEKELKKKEQDEFIGGALNRIEAIFAKNNQSAESLRLITNSLRTMENDEEFNVVILLRRMLEQSEKQSKSLSNFSTNLAEAIGEAVDKRLSTSLATLTSVVDSFKKEKSEGTQELIHKLEGAVSEWVEGLFDGFKGNIASLNDVTQGLFERVNVATEKQEKSEETLMSIVEKFESLAQTASVLQERFNETISKVSSMLSNMNETAEIIKPLTETINISQENLLNISQNLRDENASLSAERKHLSEETNNRLIKLTSLHESYVNKFSIIESGLSGIFKELENGLQQYQTDVNLQLNDAIKEFSNHFKTSSETLSSAVEELGESVDHIEELFRKFRK